MKKLLIFAFLLTSVHALEEKSKVKFSYESKDTATIERETYSLEGKLLTKLNKDLVTTEVELKEEQNFNKITDQKQLFSLLYEKYRTGFYGVYAKVEVEEDTSKKISDSRSLGLGAYQFIINQDNILFKAREGALFKTLKIGSVKENQHFLKLGIMIKGVNKFGVSLENKTDLDKGLNINHNYLTSKTTLNTKITDNFSLEISHKYNYNSKPLTPSLKYEKILSSALVYSF